MREPKNQMLGTMEPPLMQLSVKEAEVVIKQSLEKKKQALQFNTRRKARL